MKADLNNNQALTNRDNLKVKIQSKFEEQVAIKTRYLSTANVFLDHGNFIKYKFSLGEQQDLNA
jgi:hypothetical protein